MFHPGNLQSELWGGLKRGCRIYPRERERDINRIFAAAPIEAASPDASSRVSATNLDFDRNAVPGEGCQKRLTCGTEFRCRRNIGEQLGSDEDPTTAC